MSDSIKKWEENLDNIKKYNTNTHTNYFILNSTIDPIILNYMYVKKEEST